MVKSFRSPTTSIRPHPCQLPTTTAINRRQFVKTAAAATAAVIAAPAIVTACKTDSQITMGEGDYRYSVDHDWAQLPKEFEWQTTHNCTIDRDGLIYIIHEGREDRRGHPTIFVFDGDGKYVRSFGNQLAGGAHGMDLRDEGGEEFLYVTSYRPKMFTKLSLNGEEVWRRHAPMESGKYAAGEDVDNHVYGKRDTFMPTNFCFLPDGDFLVADGYGSFWIHRYDKDANWKSCFGGPGDGDTHVHQPARPLVRRPPRPRAGRRHHRPRSPQTEILHARRRVPEHGRRLPAAVPLRPPRRH